MTVPIRFAFNTDFRSPAGCEAQSEADIGICRESEAVAYARGFEDGRSSEQAGHARRLADAADAVSEQLAACEQVLESRLAALEAEAAALALAFARTLTLDLLPASTLVEETFRRVLRDLIGAVALTVTINPRILTSVDERLAAMAAGVNPNARIHLIADRSLRPEDCTIAWAQGEVSACRNERERHLSELIAQAFPRTLTNPHEPLP